MRASTVFILALSLLAGLTAASGARYVGLFNKKDPPPPADKPLPVKVLVARINVFEDIAMTSDQVAVEDLAFEDQEALARTLGQTWREKLMPPAPRAAHLRVARQTIYAGQVLLKEHFADPALPDSLSVRLEPNTRAVNVSVPKDKACGGMIRVNEHVDVLLTSRIGANGREELRTACVARACKVVMKRNSPWTVMAADPDDKPVHFTLQANAYRAALIEYAQTHGQLSLLPVQAPARGGGSFSDPSSKEYASEDQRIDGINRGELAIGDADLARVFNITATAPTDAAPQNPVAVTRHLVGVREAGQTVFHLPSGSNSPSASAAPPESPPALAPSGTFGSPTPAPQPLRPPGQSAAPAAPRSAATEPVGLTFRLPSATGTNCPTCDERKRLIEATRGR